MITVECELCGQVIGWVAPGDLNAKIAMLNEQQDHLCTCMGEWTVLSAEDHAELSKVADGAFRGAGSGS